jgi:hypothetical protein
MRTRTERRDDDEMGIGAKLTLGLLLWKATKGVVKVGALAGAAVLGWRLVGRMFERSGASESETPAVA